MEIRGFDDTIDWYDQNADEYAKNQATHLPLEAIEWFLNALPENPHVLEAGCGPGRESPLFLAKGATVIGVDLSEGLLKIAREKNPSVAYLKANFLNLPLAGSTFDGVFAHASLVHLETMDDAHQVVFEFNRVLKPGGVLFMGVKRKTGEEETEIVSDSLSNHDRFFRYYSDEDMRTLIKKAGMRLVDSRLGEDARGRTEVTWGWFLAKKEN